MTAPTIGFSVAPQDQERIRRLAARYAHGNRSSWLRQAIDLFEERELFDTLADVQARGDQRTAQQDLDREAVAELVAQAAADPDSRHAERVTALIEQFTDGGELDALDADDDSAEAFMAATEPTTAPQADV